MADQQLMTTPPLTGMPLENGSAGFGKTNPFANLFNFRELLSQPAVQSAMPAIGFGGSLLLAAGAWWSLQSPNMTPVYSGLTETDKAAVAEVLDGAGIEYEFDDGTGAIEVSEDEVHKARILLAGEGLPHAAPAGDAILANLPMGASRGLEGQALRAAREADIARTVEAMDAVETARIHLALPEPSAFVRESAPPAASVMLSLYSGRSLSSEQINSIRYLVSSSVPSLSPDQVSIVDQNGSLLTDTQVDGGGEALRMQMMMEDRYRQAIAQMLTPIVGAENFSTEVHVELDQTESQATRESFPEENRVLRREEGNTRQLPGDGNAGGGVPGALANQPPAETQATNVDPGAEEAGRVAQGPVEEAYSRSFDVGREISVTHKPQGGIERVSVAVALREGGENKLSKADVDKIEKLVQSAVGYREERGDMVTVTAASFATPEIAEPAFWDQPWFMPLVRQVGAVFVALLTFFFIGRPLVKKLRESRVARQDRPASAPAAPLIGRRTAFSEAAIAELTGPSAPRITLEMIEAAPTNEMKTELVRHFVRQDTKRAAQVVRELMQD